MDLVITDFVMPKLNGIKFIEQVHSFQPRIPIILITGCPTPLSSTIKLDAMAEVLAKPFDLMLYGQQFAACSIQLLIQQHPNLKRSVLGSEQTNMSLIE